ncbi:MAG: ABC transporter substrate-binding protein, partial [Candidatus Binataceae bacterium]
MRCLRIITVAALAVAAVIASGCRVQRGAHNHAQAQILYDSTTSDPRTFNPVLVTDAASGEAVDNLFDGLVRINPRTTLPEPALAKSWEISEGGKRITFHLRHDVKWSDGKPFLAHDVVFTLHVIYDPHVPNIEQPGLMVDGKPIQLSAPDDYTVVMNLPRPFAPLLYAIGFPIIPAHILAPALKAGDFNHMWAINTP